MLATQPSAVAPSAHGHAPTVASWKELLAPAEPFLAAVASRLREQIQAFEPDVATYAEYALTNQGKQLRPVLVALSGGATGQTSDHHVLAAVIIEMGQLAQP